MVVKAVLSKPMETTVFYVRPNTFKRDHLTLWQSVDSGKSWTRYCEIMKELVVIVLYRLDMLMVQTRATFAIRTIRQMN